MKKKRLWIVYVFLLVVFILTTPYTFRYSIKDFSELERWGSEGEVSLVEKGNLQRRIFLPFLGAFGVLLLFRNKEEHLDLSRSLGRIILFYVSFAVLSIVWSLDPALTVRRVVILVILFLGAMGLAKRLTLQEIIGLVFFICGVTLVISVVSEIVLKSFQPFSSSWRFGGVLHPISQGLNCGLLALGSFALCKLSGKRSVVYFVIALVALCFLVMTKSRMAFASTIISIGVFWYYALPKSGKMASGIIGFVIFVFSILSVFVLLKFDLRNVIIGLASFGRGAEGKASIAQMTGRIPLWEECLSYAVDRPVLGYGYNAFFTADHITQITEVIGWVPSHCHSGYIETLVSLGFVGTISLVVMLLLSLKMSIRLAKSSSEYAFTAAMMVWLCSNMFLESFLISSTSFPSFICLTLVVKMGFWEKRLLGMENKERLAISY